VSNLHVIPELDQSISLLKIQTLFAVMRDYFGSAIVQDESSGHLNILIELIRDEVFDMQERIAFQQK
jgi:hypothetical protein